jgi:uncharacterized membrane protein YkgB
LTLSAPDDRAMNYLLKLCDRYRLLQSDLDYHLVRASMVLIFLMFGYQKWFEYEAKTLIPFISNGPWIFWMYPVFGIRGATWSLGSSEWLFGALTFAGFWNKKAGALGALGGIASFVSTITMPGGYRPGRRRDGRNTILSRSLLRCCLRFVDPQWPR